MKRRKSTKIDTNGGLDMKKLLLLGCLLCFVGCTLKETVIEGTISSMTRNTMTVTAENEEYFFSTEDAEQESIHGFLIGDIVQITYAGTYKKGIKVKKIEEIKRTQPNSSDQSTIPTTWLDHGVFSSFYEKAYQRLQTLTVEEKVGQLIFARLPKTAVDEAILKYHVGGFVLFRRDFELKTKEEIQSQLAAYQAWSKIPLLLATDEEGGTVVRVSSNPFLASRPFASPQDVYQKGGMAGIEQDTLEKVLLLSELGLNVNLAPVADVSTSPSDFIYARSFGKSAKETAEYVRTVALTYHGKKFGFTLKHFPGYGNNQDTHTGIAIDNRSLEEFETTDFLPFEAGIEAGAPSILVSHNIVKAMDLEMPASLSPNVHQRLRGELGFTGVIMTDDLAMGAITEYTKGENPAVQAILAGNDLLLTTDYVASYQAIRKAMSEGTISMEQIDHSVFRILAWKEQLGLKK